MKIAAGSTAAPARAPQRFALWELGFRPFYLLAGSFAVITILCWVAQFAGWSGNHVYLAGPSWHAHEMIFGYTFAVIVGFLFTAVRNWTGVDTPTGARLAAIAALWIAARVLVALSLPSLAAVADTAFALGAAAGIAVPLVKSQNRRNFIFVAMLLGLGAANLMFYLSSAGVVSVAAGVELQSGLDLILVIIAIITGRVIPMFTANAVPGSNPLRVAAVERVAIGAVIALLLVDGFGANTMAVATVAAVACVAHSVRLALWKPWRTLARPILWILHAAYAWLCIYLALRVAAALGWIPLNLATHALTIGAIGGLTIGMMTRTARGHTGRALNVGAAETAAYVLVQLAAMARVFLPLLAPSLYLHAIVVSGVLWALAFTLFVATYWPILSRPRAEPRTP